MKSYIKKIYSGICICGHSWEDHHLGVVMNEEYLKDTEETYLPQECEFYGFNEMGGLGSDGENHCHQYKDKDDPSIPRCPKCKSPDLKFQLGSDLVGWLGIMSCGSCGDRENYFDIEDWTDFGQFFHQ